MNYQQLPKKTIAFDDLFKLSVLMNDLNKEPGKNKIQMDILLDQYKTAYKNMNEMITEPYNYIEPIKDTVKINEDIKKVIIYSSLNDDQIITKFNEFNDKIKLVKKSTESDLFLLLNEFNVLFNTHTEGCEKIKLYNEKTQDKTLIYNEYDTFIKIDNKFYINYHLAYVRYFDHISNNAPTRAILLKIFNKITKKFIRYTEKNKINLNFCDVGHINYKKRL